MRCERDGFRRFRRMRRVPRINRAERIINGTPIINALRWVEHVPWDLQEKSRSRRITYETREHGGIRGFRRPVIVQIIFDLDVDVNPFWSAHGRQRRRRLRRSRRVRSTVRL